MEKFNRSRKRIHEYIREIHNKVENRNTFSDGIDTNIVNNKDAEIPASLYGERIDSQTDLEKNLI